MHQIRYYFYLSLICLGLYLPGIAQLPLFDRDEPHFAQASKQMVESHDYKQIKFQDEPRHLKPPGIYWLQAMAVRLLSPHNLTHPWPYRLPSVLGAWLAVLLTYALSCRLAHEKTAFLAAVILATSALLIIEAHLAVTDAALLATVVAMQFSLGRIYCGDPSWRQKLIFWLAMAAGILIKGLTPLVALLTLCGLTLADRQKKIWRSLGSSWGLPLLLILTLAWLIPITLASGGNFLWDMVQGDLLPKIAGNQQSHGMPPGYFTAIFTPIFWPGSLFVVPAGIWGWRHRQEPLVRFLLAWIISIWIFFELIHTKLPEYVLPAFPAIALLIALYLKSAEKIRMNRWQKALLIIQVLLWLLCSFLVCFLFAFQGPWGWLSATLILVAASYLFYVFFRNNARLLIAGLILGGGAFIPLWIYILPHWPALWTSHRIIQLINQKAPQLVQDNRPILAIDYREPSLVFLLGTHHVRISSISEAIEQSQRTYPRLLLISPTHWSCFISLMKEKNLLWRSLGSITNFNYNRSNSKKIYIILISGMVHDVAILHQTNFLGAMASNSNRQLLFCGSIPHYFYTPAESAIPLGRDYFYPYQQKSGDEHLLYRDLFSPIDLGMAH